MKKLYSLILLLGIFLIVVGTYFFLTFNDDKTKIVSSGVIVFDSCGKLTDYQEYDWMELLNQEYSEEFLTPQGLEGDIGEFGEGCLSLDGTRFIFIPEYSEFGCGRFFRYEISTNTLSDPHACASTFGEITNDYVTFTSTQGDGGSCTRYDGKYYFSEDRVESSPGTSCK